MALALPNAALWCKLLSLLWSLSDCPSLIDGAFHGIGR